MWWVWVASVALLAPHVAWALPEWPPSPEAIREAPEVGSGKDWMQLNTGEWLNGELRRMREGDVEFDSDKLGIVTYEFNDIAVIYVPRNATWVLRDGTLKGPGVVAEDNLIVDDLVHGPSTKYRGDITGIVSIGTREIDNWSFSAKVGLDARWGNAQQLTWSAGGSLIREGAKLLWDNTYDGSFGTTRGVQSVNSHSFDTSLQWYFHPVFYLVPIGYSLFIDPFQNLALRTNPRTGFGARVVGQKLRVGGNVGVTSFVVKYESVQAGQDSGFVGYGPYVDVDFKWEITADLTVAGSWSTTVVVNRIGQTFHRGQISIDQEIVDIFSIEFTGTLDRTEDPPPLSDGTVVVPNDVKLLAYLKITL